MSLACVTKLTLLCILVSVAWGEEASRAVTPATVSRKMAQHLFESSGSPVLLLGTNDLKECQPVNSGDSFWIAAPEDVVTEFEYSSAAICVSVYVRGGSGSGVVRFDPARFKNKFGAVPDGEFSVRQRLAFVFPRDPSTSPEADALGLFFRKVARPVNLGRPGSLASAMKEVESPEAASKFAGDLLGKSPDASAAQTENGEPSPETMPEPDRSKAGAKNWKYALLPLGVLLLGGALVLFFRYRSRARQAELADLEPVVEPAPKQVVKGPPRVKGPGRRLLALPVNSPEDQKAVNDIDALILDLTRKAGFKWSEVEDIVKQTQALSKLATKEGLPVLDIVKEFLTEQIKQAHLRKGAPIARGIR